MHQDTAKIPNTYSNTCQVYITSLENCDWRLLSRPLEYQSIRYYHTEIKKAQHRTLTWQSDRNVMGKPSRLLLQAWLWCSSRFTVSRQAWLKKERELAYGFVTDTNPLCLGDIWIFPESRNHPSPYAYRLSNAWQLVAGSFVVCFSDTQNPIFWRFPSAAWKKERQGWVSFRFYATRVPNQHFGNEAGA